MTAYEFDIDHPEHDCPDCHVTHDCSDCGQLHMPWSLHEADRRKMEEVWPDVMLLASRLEAVLDGADPWIARAAIRVAEDNYSKKHSDYYRL